MLLRMFFGEGTAALKKNQHKHLDRSGVNALVSIFHLQRIP
jgi:hypothetical protein